MKTENHNLSVRRGASLKLIEHNDGNFSMYIDFDGNSFDSSEPVDAMMIELMMILQKRFGDGE